ncbi:uncharacterized protein LOC130789414 [Actinidia eriantha]|uniref:uncharacterized protein LOC130789414 n=1 Tax=Actinidia eriantha TaxID=165200 RepID=UPI002587E791|nr:uncharacterized protein LOC130789414 [Actinidia eriantha]
MQSGEDHCQEINESGRDFHSAAVHRLALLTLNNAFTSTTTEATHRCIACGSSVKRPPPSSPSLQEPTPKKQQISLLTSPSSSSTATSTTTTSLPVLRRCISDPINSPGTTTATQCSPETAKTNVLESLPPLPQILGRSVSDPLHSPHHLTTAATTTTTPHTAPRKSPLSPNSGELGAESNRGEGRSSRRLNLMKDRMREMILWWDQFVRDGEDEGIEGNNNANCNGDGEKITECDECETEVAVSVERTGDCLVIHFKCPCNRGYQILLAGNNCYYKLM